MYIERVKIVSRQTSIFSYLMQMKIFKFQLYKKLVNTVEALVSTAGIWFVSRKVERFKGLGVKH